MGRNLIESAKSIAGAGLAAAGMFILYQDVGRAAVELSHTFGRAGMAVLPILLVASRVAQAYAANHRPFVKDFMVQVLMASWPLILVMAGSCWSRQGLRSEGAALQKKDR